MTLPSANAQSPAHQNNVRLVVVDDKHQPTYLAKAVELQKALTATAARHGVLADDLPGLYGLCIEGVRSAEARGR